MSIPSEILSTSDPGDDMQRRIRYQAAYGALLSLQLITDSEMSQLFCEQHEDFLVRKANGLFVGYQVKTRLPHLGPFKSDEEPMVSTIERFVKLDIEFPDQFERFVIVANCDFWQAEDNGKNLVFVIKGMRERPSAKLTGTASEIVELLQEKCGCAKKKIVATISKIHLDGSVPKFDDITANVTFAIGGIAAFKNRELPELHKCAEALISTILLASALTCHQPIRHHFVSASDPSDAIVKSKLQQKLILGGAVLELIHASLAELTTMSSSQTLDAKALPLGHHKLEKKMAAGEIPFHDIDLAKDHQLSAEYALQSWLGRYDYEQANKRYKQVDLIVRTQCLEAYDDEISTSQPFGKSMLSNVRKRLKATAATSNATFDLRYEHLLGLASMATQECKVWWSEPFAVGGDD
jgi:hypothetical protein